MKILVFGAGVIGSTYAWQLSEAGYDVSMFIRKQRMVRYSHSGISINCTDLRGSKKLYFKTVFRPKTIDKLDPNRLFDLIIVCLKNFQLKDAVPYISKFSGSAHILFLGNIWHEFEFIEENFSKNRVSYGFPGITGGGRSDNSITCTLFKNGNTMLGQTGDLSGKFIGEIAHLFGTAGLQPKIIHNIDHWIKPHVIWEVATFGAICKAGNAKAFASAYKSIKHSALAIKEGLNVAKKEQVRVWAIFPYNLFYLPSFIITVLLKNSYKEEMLKVIERHMKHGFDELKKLYDDILNDGTKHDIHMPYLRSYEKYILETENTDLVR
jgi:ketopantoate reductase